MTPRPVHIITTRDRIRGVADAWREQYRPAGEWIAIYGDDKRLISKRLDALDKERATAADVTAVIGNDTWTALSCDQCEQRVDVVAQLGAEPDYDSPTANVCVDCLRAALGLVATRLNKPVADPASTLRRDVGARTIVNDISAKPEPITEIPGITEHRHVCAVDPGHMGTICYSRGFCVCDCGARLSWTDRDTHANWKARP